MYIKRSATQRKVLLIWTPHLPSAISRLFIHIQNETARYIRPIVVYLRWPYLQKKSLLPTTAFCDAHLPLYSIYRHVTVRALSRPFSWRAGYRRAKAMIQRTNDNHCDHRPCRACPFPVIYRRLNLITMVISAGAALLLRNPLISDA